MSTYMAGKKSLNILIIDDDEDDYFITSRHIKNINSTFSFNIEWCPDYKEAVEEICKSRFDLYLIDFQLGAKTGLDLIKEAIGNNCEEPMILLTGRGNQEIDIMAMEAGAVDYLVKSDINIEKLERAIRYAVGRHEFIKALKANEQKFRSIFEKSKDCVFIADEQFFFKDVNQAACMLFEYSKEEMLGLSLFDLLRNKNDQRVIEQGLVLKGEVSDKELIFLDKDNERIDGILSVSREMDEKGHSYLQGIIHDITNLKKAERATLKAEKLKATERLVLTLAHEVRNPLNNINLSTQQLCTEITGDEPQLYLEIINRNSKRIGDLITELLNSSRPTEIELQKTSLTAVLDESIAAALDRIQLKRITLQADYHNTKAPITGDPGKLKIAFLNIIINAVEAMKEGEGKLSIEIINGNSAYIVSIKDNGTGISEENLTKLFEPYYTSKPNGMGLGLASTLSILQSHKASVDVNSKPDQGTTFFITFEKQYHSAG